MRIKKLNRMQTQRTTKFKAWCDLCDAILTGDTGVCSNCGCKAKREFPKRLKNTNFDQITELDLDD